MNSLELTQNEMTSERPWLSVVIPIYNAEKYLEECLASIHKQSFKDYEVLLVDDGSTDSTPEICGKYKTMDRRFHYLKKDNGGAFQTRIYGTEHSAGEYITFCDADDYYYTENAFAKIHEEILTHKIQVLQFGFCKKYNHLKRKQPFVDKPFNVNGADFQLNEYPKLLCSSWDAAHMNQSVVNKVYHRSLLKNLPKSQDAERVFYGEDLILNLHLLSSCSGFRFIPDILYCYRQFSGDTNRFSRRTMEDMNRIKMYQLKNLAEYSGNSKDRIKRNLHAETAGWLYYYVREALDHLDENELKKLINDVLQLPAVKEAYRYFTEENDENWEAVSLLKSGNADEFIIKAKAYKKKKSVKDILKKEVKKILVSI